jgi:hypothetical protein
MRCGRLLRNRENPSRKEDKAKWESDDRKAKRGEEKPKV